MMTAMLTARNVLAGQRLYDIWSVNEDAEYHEAGEFGAREMLRSERLAPRKVTASQKQVVIPSLISIRNDATRLPARTRTYQDWW
jgi:hypothetical protein